MNWLYIQNNRYRDDRRGSDCFKYPHNLHFSSTDIIFMGQLTKRNFRLMSCPGYSHQMLLLFAKTEF